MADETHDAIKNVTTALTILISIAALAVSISSSCSAANRSHEANDIAESALSVARQQRMADFTISFVVTLRTNGEYKEWEATDFDRSRDDLVISQSRVFPGVWLGVSVANTSNTPLTIIDLGILTNPAKGTANWIRTRTYDAIDDCTNNSDIRCYKFPLLIPPTGEEREFHWPIWEDIDTIVNEGAGSPPIRVVLMTYPTEHENYQFDTNLTLTEG